MQRRNPLGRRFQEPVDLHVERVGRGLVVDEHAS